MLFVKPNKVINCEKKLHGILQNWLRARPCAASTQLKGVAGPILSCDAIKPGIKNKKIKRGRGKYASDNRPKKKRLWNEKIFATEPK